MMTAGEKAIWAAAFVAERARQLRNPPPWAYNPKNDASTKEWMSGCASSAAEVAHAAVAAAREAEARVVKGWGADSEVTTMLQEMLHV